MYESAYNIELRTELTDTDRKLADHFHKNGVGLGGSLLDCLYDHNSTIKSVMLHSREVISLLGDGFRIGRRKSKDLSDAVIDRAVRTAQEMHEVRRETPYGFQVADLHFNDYQSALDYLTEAVEELEEVAPKQVDLAKSF